MTGYDTIVIVDWASGNDTGPKPRKDAIWACVLRDEAPGAPVYLRNRAVAEDWLARLFQAELAAGRRIFAGFDFPFGYPLGFARRVTGTDDPLVLWDWFARHLEDAPKGNNRFHLAGHLNRLFPGTGPFWFTGLKAEIPDLPRKGRARDGHGMAERRACDRAAGAFTCWQMGGAGAVGGQVMTGMACLSRLRARFADAIAVWPFEALDRPIALVEVWPSLFSRQIAAQTRPREIRDAAQVRYVANLVRSLRREGQLEAVLNSAPEDARLEEGWIFGLHGQEQRQVA